MANNIPVQVVINAVDNASKVFSSVGTGISGMGKSITNLNQGQTALAGGMAALGAAAGLMSQSFVSVAGDMEQNKVAFEVMLRSADKAKVMLQDLTSFAARTPFNLQGVVEAGKQLLAYGFDQKEVITTTEMLGNVASGLKIPLGDIIYLFGTLRAQGRAYTKDLNQFTARGIPILDELAKQYGITTAEVFKYAETGRIGFADVEKAFQNMTKEGGQFFNLMDRQSQTTLGRLSNFEDSVYQLKGALGEALLPSVNELITTLIPLIKRFGEFAKENPKIVSGILRIAIALGALGTAVLTLGPIFAGIGAVISMVTASWGAIVTVIGGVAAFLTGPIGIALIAIIGLIGLLTTAWLNNWGDIQGKTSAVVNYITGSFGKFIDVLKNLKDYFHQVFTDGDWLNDSLSGIPEAIRPAIESMGWFIRVIQDTPAYINQLVSDTITGFSIFGSYVSEVFNNILTSITNFFTYAINSFLALPESLVVLRNALIDVLYKFFFSDFPYALGFAVGSLEKFITETLPFFAGQLVTFFTETLPQTLLNFYNAWTQMLLQVTEMLVNFALVTVPEALSNMITWIQVNVPIMAAQFVAYLQEMGIKSVAAIIAMGAAVISGIVGMANSSIGTVTYMKDSAVSIVGSMKDNVVLWIKEMVASVQKTVDELPGKIGKAFMAAKDNAVNAARSLFDGVSEWMNRVKQLFEDIISTAQRAIDTARQAFSMGQAQGKRQFGGPVSSTSSYLVGEDGPEIFTPSTAGNITPNSSIGKGGGGPVIQFIINAENIINSPNERRGLAEALLTDLRMLARSQNLSVSEYLEGA